MSEEKSKERGERSKGRSGRGARIIEQDARERARRGARSNVRGRSKGMSEERSKEQR